MNTATYLLLLLSPSAFSYRFWRSCRTGHKTTLTDYKLAECCEPGPEAPVFTPRKEGLHPDDTKPAPANNDACCQMTKVMHTAKSSNGGTSTPLAVVFHSTGIANIRPTVNVQVQEEQVKTKTLQVAPEADGSQMPAITRISHSAEPRSTQTQTVDTLLIQMVARGLHPSLTGRTCVTRTAEALQLNEGTPNMLPRLHCRTAESSECYFCTCTSSCSNCYSCCTQILVFEIQLQLLGYLCCLCNFLLIHLQVRRLEIFCFFLFCDTACVAEQVPTWESSKGIPLALV